MRMGLLRGSSFLKAVGFSDGPGSIGSLRIRFDDATIEFRKVPYSVYRGLVVAKDHSAYYFKHIYGQYDYKKV